MLALGIRFTQSMHRLTARLLLFFTLVGSLAPQALAAIAPPPHACCIRKAAHPCHGPALPEGGQLVISDAAGGCNHDCRRATISAQWAHPKSRAAAFFGQAINARIASPQPDSPASAAAEFQSTRAPPAC
jgi:hypothetical protein